MPEEERAFLCGKLRRAGNKKFILTFFYSEE